MYTGTVPVGNSAGNFYNVGGVTQVTAAPTWTLGTWPGSPVYYLVSGRELYGPSYIVGLAVKDFDTTSGKALETATFGSVRAFYGTSVTNTYDLGYKSAWSHIMLVGTLLGKGMYTSIDVTTPASGTLGTAATYSSYFLTDSTNCGSGVCTLSAPAGGIAQFKGLE